ncbi:MAG: thioesterase family protein [Caulobacteraceae bacterium]
MTGFPGREIGPGKEIWRGGVTPWQCDEMGHMNVQFYLAIASQGLAGLAAMLGMPHAFTSGASSTLMLREHHVRFLKEARPGAGLVMTGGLLDITETEATLLQLLFHVTGEPAAAITCKVEHVTPRDLRPFPWTRATRERVEAMRIEAPEFARPRSISVDPVETMASLKQAEAMGLPVVSGGAIMPVDCDVFGRMLPEQMLNRVYASVGHMIRPSHEALLQAHPELHDRLGGAAVEYRVVYHAWPRAGDRVEMRSAHRELTAKARRVVHWLLDPTSGRPWASAEMVSLFLDLKARRSLTLSPEALDAMAIDPMDELGL